MKNIYVFIAILSLALTSCDKDYEEHYRVTYYPDIVIEGESLVFSPVGETYVDAGANTTENGVEIETKVSSNVDDSAVGSYTVTYSATNVDGYDAEKSRTVIIYDPNTNTTDISGNYSGNVLRNGTRGYNGNPVTLEKVEGMDGIYAISDWIAGFYDVGTHYNYGPDYRFVGYMQINADNEVLLLDMSNPWGDPFNSVTGTYNPTTHVVSYVASWLSYNFVVDLTFTSPLEEE